MSETEEVILKYLHKYPYLTRRKLAELIISEKALNLNRDYLRQIISDVIKKNKNQNNDIVIDVEDFDFPDVPSYAEEIKFYELPDKYNRILVISDIHIKYHDNNAIRTALKYGHNNSCDTIILNGDIVDFVGISRWDKSYKDRDISAERDLAVKFFQILRDKFKEQKIIFKAGNHELRLKRFIRMHAEQLEGISELELDNFLRLYQVGFDYVDAYSIINIGKLNVIHGHEILGGGINVARLNLLKTLDNILFGHFHRTQDYIQRSILNETYGSWSVGCLCGLSPQYNPINNWNHGFAFIIRDGKYFEVQNKKIINGNVL